MPTNLVLIGYSGHAYVCAESALLNNHEIVGYCDTEEKRVNPFQFAYLGKEKEYLSSERNEVLFVSIGSNNLREKIMKRFPDKVFMNLIHPRSIVSQKAIIEPNANILIGAGAIVNPLVKIGKGVILNTACVVEHECMIEEYAHIAPGAVLAGNVKVGKRAFVGANAVIKQGVVVGDDVIIGAGSVVINDVSDGATVMGNPAREKI